MEQINLVNSLSNGNYRTKSTDSDLIRATRRMAIMYTSPTFKHEVDRSRDMRYVTFDKGSTDYRSDINGM